MRTLFLKDYAVSSCVSEFGAICESHEYANDICSVMDKLTAYVRRNANLMSSSLNESAKQMYDRDVLFNSNERIAAKCIFNEMLTQYEKHIMEEIRLCESIIAEYSMINENTEYDYKTLESLLVTEGIGDWLKAKYNKGKDAIQNFSKKVIANAKSVTSDAVEVTTVKAKDLVAQAKQVKSDYEEKFKNLKALITEIVKSGITSVKSFIDKIFEVFAKVGDNLADVVKKFGCSELEKGEQPAELSGIATDNLYKNAKSVGEKSFINNIIIRVEAMLTKDKTNTNKIMNESLVDNKFIAWLSGYKNGTKMSWWKSILIGLCASLIVWLIPHVLPFMGVGAALTAFIAALVGVTWSGIGLLRLIYRRKQERKPGEKFFDKKTAIFFALSILSITFTSATFLKTIGPLMREICNHMGWTGGEDMSKFGEFIYSITKKISPKDCFQPGSLEVVSEQIKNYGGDFRGTDLVTGNKEAVEAMRNMKGASEENVNAFEKFLSEIRGSKGSSGVLAAAKRFSDDPNLPTTYMLDNDKWGTYKFIKQAIDDLAKQGEIPDSAIIATAGSVSTQAASGGVYGTCTILTGLSENDAMQVMSKAAELAGADASHLTFNAFGTGSIADMVIHRETINPAFNVLAPNIPFLPIMVPFFDKKKWGDYKMRFASATTGEKSYIVEKVEMLPGDKIDGNSPALDKLKQLHKNAWEEYQTLDEKSDAVNEGLFNRKKDKKEDTKIEEPQYIVFFVNPNKESEGKKTAVVGVVIDTLTMMCADVCEFNTKRRQQPYFMKGLLARLSFRPVKNNDNETKDYIRTTLGQTMNTLIQQNVMFGLGKKYIETKTEGKKTVYSLRKQILGTDKSVNATKELFEMGNFSPNEALSCLGDDGSNNKKSYELLDGNFATKVSIKVDDKGNVTHKVSKDNATIENVRYYKVPDKEREKQLKEYEKKKNVWKKTGKGKKPVRPSFKQSADGNYYKRASKKYIKDNPTVELFDFVDVTIIPILLTGKLRDELCKDDKIKKVLYDGDKLNDKVIKVLKPFLYRPEKTFAKEDEHKLAELLKAQGVEGEKLGWFKNLFKDEEQLHDTFKSMVEIIWDYLSQKKNSKVLEDYDENYSLFNYLVEEFEAYIEDDEDLEEINEQENTTLKIMKFDEFMKLHNL